MPEYKNQGLPFVQPKIDKAIPISAKEKLIPNAASTNLAWFFFMIYILRSRSQPA